MLQRQRRFFLPGVLLLLCLSNMPRLLLAADDAVVAKINEQQITLGAVKTKLKLVANQLTAENEARVFAEVLQGMLDQQLLGEYLRKAEIRPTDEEIKTAVQALEKQLKQRDPKMTLERFAAATGQSLTQMQNQISNTLALQKLVLGPNGLADLEKFYQEHQAEYDGSELRVRHILLRPLRAGDAKELTELAAQAERIRSDILAGKTTFEKAALAHSAGPSRFQGGDLGFIRREGPMVEAFNRAAFALRKDDGTEISPPVLSSFGVHLISRTGSKPGSKTLEQVREQIQPQFMQRQTELLLEKLRPTAKVEISPLIPHLRWGTRELVLPK